MAPAPSQDLRPRAQRPSISSQGSSSSNPRHPSTGSIPPLSPTVGSVSKSSNPQKQRRQHTVGGTTTRAHGHHPRPPSYGKNLNKLTKITNTQNGDGAAGGGGTSPPTPRKHHQRSRSHTPSTSPRAPSNGLTRANGSQVSLPRNGSHVSLRKNHSTTSLKRNTSSTSIKAKKPAASANPSRRSLTSTAATPAHKSTSVRFDLGGPPGHNDDSPTWTETSSANSSPAATRPSTSASNTQPTLPVSPPASPDGLSPTTLRLQPHTQSFTPATPQTSTVSAIRISPTSAPGSNAQPSSDPAPSALLPSSPTPTTPAAAANGGVYRIQRRVMLQRDSFTINAAQQQQQQQGDSPREMARLYERTDSAYSTVRKWRSPVVEGVRRRVCYEGGKRSASGKGEGQRDGGEVRGEEGGVEEVLRRMWERMDVPVDRE
ncbi:MAG: hypothetical protein M1814_003877 [Vezdaea aestivalis]|nr:MAG: hypothetical protein M1814_003877 [Vezdaea aestivalis]